MSIHASHEEHHKNILDGAVPPEYTHDTAVPCDASNDFQLYYIQTIYCLRQTTSYQNYTACRLISIYVLSEMMHQYDLLTLDL